MNISKVEDFIAYTMTKDILKSAVGDGMEFELMYQAILDSMESKMTSEGSNDLNIINNTATGDRLDELPMVIKGQYVGEVYGGEPLDFSLDSLNYNSYGTNAITRSSISSPELISTDYTTKSGSDLAEIYATVEKYSEKYGVDSNLVLAIIKQESNFNPNAESPVGAKGLMQLMDFNSEAYGITNPFDSEANIEGGVRHLSSYLDMYGGNVEMALMAYNGGPGTMSRRGVTSTSDLYKMPQETQNYVAKVMDNYQNMV